MKKTLLAIASVAALSATAMPAAAQSYYRGGAQATRSIDAEQAQIRNRIARAEQNGRLSHREAQRLRVHLRNIDRLQYSYRVNDGRISPREHAALDARLDRLRVMMRAEIRDGDRRYGYGYGRW